MDLSSYLAIRGQIVTIGKDPDGDSVRFQPDRPALLKRLTNSYRLRISKDNTVQLRLEGIDAPETHYQGRDQPLGLESRNALLAQLGFRNVAPLGGGPITSANPRTKAAVILTKLVETNGRPVAYLYTGSLTGLRSGTEVKPDEALITRSHNLAILRSGLCYPIIYTSMPAAQQRIFRAEATRARDGRLGVWSQDASSQFELTNATALDPAGQLIYPKLFRRCIDYFRAQSRGFQGNLPDWLKSTVTAADVGENDELWLAGRPARLSDVITQTGTTISYTADLIETIFVEK